MVRTLEKKPAFLIDVDDNEKAYCLLADKYDVEKTNKGIKITGNIELNEVLKIIQNAGLLIMGVNKQEGDIEKYYLSLIGARNV